MLHKAFAGSQYMLIKYDENCALLGYYAASIGIATNCCVMELPLLAA